MVAQKIKVGDVGTIVKAKHRWNNGKEVMVYRIGAEEDTYYAYLVSNLNEKFILGARNFSIYS